MGIDSLRGYPFSYYLIGAIFLILMIAVAGLIGISYLSTYRTLEENAELVTLQSENNIISHFRSKEEALRYYDESLNQQMERAFPAFLEEYARAGGDPAVMDLEAVKQEIGGEMELYVIDDTATIVATTYPRELGLNFSEFAPYFADYLAGIRTSSGFFPDRIIGDKSAGEVKKFAYMPTPDHRYILEVGFSNLTTPTGYRYVDENLIRKVKQSNPYLVNVRIFDTTLRQRINDTPVETGDPALTALLRGVLANRTTLDIPNHSEANTVKYLFIDLKDERYGSDVSRIVELTYSDQPIHAALNESALSLLSLGLLALVICSLLAVIVIRTLTRPIETMVEDVNRIAEGDLDHPITPPISAELITLEESISSMVTRLKAMMADLKAEEEQYRILVQSANSIIIQFDRYGTITFFNNYALKFFGFGPEDIIGRNVVGTIVPEYGSNGEDLRFKILDLAVHPEKYEVTENENTKKDGSRVWIAWTNQPLYDEKGTIVQILSIGNDITRLQEAEREIQELNNELENRVIERTRQLTEVNKNLESFSYTVSHDLRAPLRAISGYSSILLQDLKDIPEKDRRYLESLRQNAHEMGRLIDDLLDFSRLRIRSLEKETVQPAMMVKEILREFRKDPSVATVEFKVGDLPPCQADPGLLKQVYANLIGNAIKYSRKREHPVVEIGSLSKDGQLIFFVRDNGIGFDMKYSEKIFGVFQRLQTSDEYEGTGIGLAIVQRIIEMHGGRIWVESHVDKGTTFYFSCW
jgi:PAS domain S-box-containing protein